MKRGAVHWKPELQHQIQYLCGLEGVEGLFSTLSSYVMEVKGYRNEELYKKI